MGRKRSSGGRKLEAKVVIVGSASVGKTCLVTQYISGNFDKGVRPTIGCSFFPKEVSLDGMERFRAMAPMYYRGCSGAVVLYDITRTDTFAAVNGWVSELRDALGSENLVIAVVGNKNDLAAKRKVSTEQGHALAASLRAHFFETSALTAEGVDEMFTVMAKDIVRVQGQKEASRGDPSILLGFADADDGGQGSCCSGGGTAPT